ncbi:MAG: hypothetical protein RL731_1131, partial [Bacteroidota bacterium]
MVQVMDILKVANQNGLEPGMSLIYSQEQQVPGSIEYQVKRYYALQPWTGSDTGMLIYHYDAKKPLNSYLELRFCISGNRFCEEKSCAQCEHSPTNNCFGKHETVDTFTFHFTSTFLRPYVQSVKVSNYKDDVLAFKHPNAFTKVFPLCSRKRSVLDTLLNHSYTG